MKILLTIFFCYIFLVENLFGQIDTTQAKILEEVIFTSEKIKNEKIIVCNLKYTITANEIANNNANNTGDLLANIGAISLQKSQQGGGSPVIRGFEANKLLLMVDGVRLNNLIYRGGHLQNILSVDQAVLDKIEVLYGPTSSLYGSDALGGVIHLFTKNPKLEEKSASGYFRQLMNGQGKSINGSYNLGGKKWAALGAITIANFDNLRMGAKINPALGAKFGERNKYVLIDNSSGFRPDEIVENPNPLIQLYSAYTQADFLQKILYQPNEKAKHILNIQHSTSTDIPRYDRLTDTNKNGVFKWAEWYYGPQNRWLLGYQFDKKETEKGLNINLNFQQVTESRHERLFAENYLNNRIENVQVFGATINKYRYFNRDNLSYGIDLQYNNLKSEANSDNLTSNEVLPLNTRYPNGKNYMANLSFYGLNSWQITEKLKLNKGIRIGFNSLYSDFADQSFFKFPFSEVKQNNFVYSGNLGLVINPNPNLKLAAMVATGFRVPNTDDLAKVFDSAPGLLIVPNQNLKPEKTLNYEIGITSVLSPKIFIESAFFLTNFYDAIVLDYFSFNGQTSLLYNGVNSKILANQNVRRARIYGINMALNASFFKNVKFSASFNYTKGQIKSSSNQYNLPLDHIPPSYGKIGLKYSYSKLYMENYLLFNAWKRIDEYMLNGEDNEKYASPLGTPAWQTLNGRMGYSFTEKWSLHAGIDNVFDLQYRTFASGISAAGRNFFITFRGGL